MRVQAVRRHHGATRTGKAYFVAEIADWIATPRQQQADYTRPQEIGSAAKGRPSLLVRALLDGVAYCYLKTAKTLGTKGLHRKLGDLLSGRHVLSTTP